MKRELKLGIPGYLLCHCYGCSPNPYEEGTETSVTEKKSATSLGVAAAQIPMKRELKLKTEY